MTQRSWPELKSRVWHSTNWAHPGTASPNFLATSPRHSSFQCLIHSGQVGDLSARITKWMIYLRIKDKDFPAQNGVKEAAWELPLHHIGLPEASKTLGWGCLAELLLLCTQWERPTLMTFPKNCRKALIATRSNRVLLPNHKSSVCSEGTQGAKCLLL